MRECIFVADSSVVEFFSGRTRREREDLLRAFQALADSPSCPEDWIQRTPSGRNLRVRRSGRWLIAFWLDQPVLELRIVDVHPIPA